MIGKSVEVKMPDFSELSDDLPYVSKWFIKVGDSVKIGDVIAELELWNRYFRVGVLYRRGNTTYCYKGEIQN